ncbi:MAG: HNH endonuclease signature motif containing protein, partial [Parcubacteria group bacterium]
IYPYVLTRQENYLNIRAFTDKMKRESYERQKGKCVICKKPFEIEEMEAHHNKLWSEGGKTIAQNCQMLCKDDHREKSGK